MTRRLDQLQIVVSLAFLASIFLSRPLTSLGFPGIINMVHMGFVPLGMILVFFNHRAGHGKLITVIGIFFAVSVVSGAITGAGVLNVLLFGIIMTEPFVLYLLLTTPAWRRVRQPTKTQVLDSVMLLNLAFAVVQVLVFGYRSDDVRGFFINAGAGSHLNGSIGLCYALYFSLMRRPRVSKNLQYLVWFLALANVWVADAKTAILSLAIALGGLALFKVKRPTFAVAIALTASGVAWLLFYYVTKVIEITSIQMITDGLSQKFSVVQIINDEMSGFHEYIWGLGPGHSISRVALLLPDYHWLSDYFQVTTHPITENIKYMNQENYLSNSVTGSSIYSMYNSWISIWGDVGPVGVLVYSWLLKLVYNDCRYHDGGRLLIFFAIIMGMIFSYLGEPGFTCAIMWMIALQVGHLPSAEIKA
jgi:hypothetical protein